MTVQFGGVASTAAQRQAFLDDLGVTAAITTPVALAVKYALQTPGFFSVDVPDTQQGTARFPWKPSSPYVRGAIRCNNGNVYMVTNTSGTSAASGGPTGTTSAITDGGVTWAYMSADPDQWKPNTLYALGTWVNNLNNLYVCTTAGTSAASGGPNIAGTGIADNAAIWSRVTQYFVDTVNGNDANISGSGQVPSAPTKTTPVRPSSLASNGKLWIAAGSNFAVDPATGNGGLYAIQQSPCVTVFDPVTGNECRDQPRSPPGLRIFGRQQLTQAEINKSYFTVQSTVAGMTFAAVASTGGINVLGPAANAPGIIRGAYVTGCYYGIALGQAAPTRIEDCIFINNGLVANGASGVYGGCNVRDQSNATGNKMTRCILYSDGVGEDGMWGSVTPQPLDWAFNDVWIFHRPPSGGFNANHRDALQMGKYPGALVQNRCLFEHYLPESDMTDDGGGVDQVGACFILDGTGNSNTTSSLTQSSCIFVSNLLAHNLQAITGNQYRCVNLVAKFNRNQPSYLFALNSTGLNQTDCKNITADFNSPYDKANFGFAFGSKTRVDDISL